MSVAGFRVSSVDWDTATITPADGEAYWRAHGVKAPGPSRQTASGIEWFFLDPDPASVNIADIAHHLARLNRWGGSLNVPCYSVAQHAALTALIAWTRSGGDPMVALWGLHHDDEEAYLGDMVGPLKSLGEMAYFRWIARLNQRAIMKALGLPLEEPPLVKQIDRDLRVAEHAAFMGQAIGPRRGTYSDKGQLPCEFRFGDPWQDTTTRVEFSRPVGLHELGGSQVGQRSYAFFGHGAALGPLVTQWEGWLHETFRRGPKNLRVPRGCGRLIISAWKPETAAIVFESLHDELVTRLGG